MHWLTQRILRPRLRALLSCLTLASPAGATWSIIALDPVTGLIGIDCASGTCADRTLAERLTAALVAGGAAGGDRRCGEQLANHSQRWRVQGMEPKRTRLFLVA